MIKSKLILASSVSMILALSTGAAAASQPSAMKIPVDSKTKPADTTDKDLGSNTEADNTLKNETHDGRSAVSADQQGNSKEDVEITSRIRRLIVNDKNLSTYAHNVKIITNQGRVVLKGPVNSNEEKRQVEALAKNVAGDHVLSEIEVK